MCDVHVLFERAEEPVPTLAAKVAIQITHQCCAITWPDVSWLITPQTSITTALPLGLNSQLAGAYDTFVSS